MVVLSLCSPGTTENTARERARPTQEREEQSTVSKESAEVREEEEVNTPLMSISTAKLVKWLQEHLPTGKPGERTIDSFMAPGASRQAFLSGATSTVPPLGI